MRLDIYLVSNGFFESREKAVDAIRSGLVSLNGRVAAKPAVNVTDDCIVSVNSSMLLPYVSKGGLKLKRAVDVFGLDFSGLNVLDAGSSTGGFTDCCLQHGASHVWAVDVGTSQLHPSLHGNNRITSVENTDIRSFPPSQLLFEPVDAIVGDLSFISLRMVFPALQNLLKPSGFAVLLIKPQFEAGAQHVGRTGIVTKPAVHNVVISQVATAAASHGFFLSRITHAPIREAKKNIEYLALFTRENCPLPSYSNVVLEAFALQKSIKG
ncbi:MAG TPA: TlyA family RNA methyltransferase [Tenuifilaceae bacterium]|nr:TlyA family RNA methyltransferase [Tenuifilaceae bacterium]HQB77967.1 TlyA family RNA methyltransferase [Tenuifilaceae bacterium]